MDAMTDLDGAQTRQLVDSEQVYSAFRATQAEYRQRFAGSLAWKTVGGRRYLYRKSGGAWKSLGVEAAETSRAYDQFHAGRAELKARRDSLDARIAAMAPVNRAMRIGRVPWAAARVLRRLEKIGVLGHGFKVAGTHALYAYERMGGVHFAASAVATMDIDLLYDARGALDLVGSGLADTGLLALLQSIDPSFAATAPGSYRAVNDKGFMIDLIMPAARDAATRRPCARVGRSDDDLAAVEIAGLTWLESSPTVMEIVIDERGYPLTIVAPDPRAFAMHKSWLARRDDRHPAKRRRDAAQAEAVAAMLARHLPHLRFDDPALSALPVELRDLGGQLAAGADVAAGASEWDE